MEGRPQPGRPISPSRQAPPRVQGSSRSIDTHVEDGLLVHVVAQPEARQERVCDAAREAHGLRPPPHGQDAGRQRKQHHAQARLRVHPGQHIQVGDAHNTACVWEGEGVRVGGLSIMPNMPICDLKLSSKANKPLSKKSSVHLTHWWGPQCQAPRAAATRRAPPA